MAQGPSAPLIKLQPHMVGMYENDHSRAYIGVGDRFWAEVFTVAANRFDREDLLV